MNNRYHSASSLHSGMSSVRYLVLRLQHMDWLGRGGERRGEATIEEEDQSQTQHATTEIERIRKDTKWCNWISRHWWENDLSFLYNHCKNQLSMNILCRRTTRQGKIQSECEKDEKESEGISSFWLRTVKKRWNVGEVDSNDLISLFLPLRRKDRWYVSLISKDSIVSLTDEIQGKMKRRKHFCTKDNEGVQPLDEISPSLKWVNGEKVRQWRSEEWGENEERQEEEVREERIKRETEKVRRIHKRGTAFILHYRKGDFDYVTPWGTPSL